MDTEEMRHWAVVRKGVCEAMLDEGGAAQDFSLWFLLLPSADREAWIRYQIHRLGELRSLFGTRHILYEDPPWRFQNWSIGEKAKYGEKWTRKNGRSTYNVIETHRLCRLNVSLFAARDCIRFTWETSPKRKEVLQYIEGQKIVTARSDRPVFEYKAVGFTWVKVTQEAYRRGSFTEADFRMGMGFWSRKNAEQCLISTRGAPKRVDNTVKELIFCPVGEHSAKPPETRDRIKQLVGDLPALELFARHPVPKGWEATGLDYDGMDIFDVLEGMK